jgi:hypothetical protein
MYSCPKYKPRHLSVAIDKYNYKIAYYNLIGGVLNFNNLNFIQINGYSNLYWGWGAEDDDMQKRLDAAKIHFERPHIRIAHYTMLKHAGRYKNPNRRTLLKKAQLRYKEDGLNTVHYDVIQIKKYQLFTHIQIDVGDPTDEIK